jgi:thioredoxin-like negative regulator of GroEL
MTIPSASAGESLERVLCLIEKLEFHQRRMEDILSAILDLSEPGDDLAVECRRLLSCLRSE